MAYIVENLNVYTSDQVFGNDSCRFVGIDRVREPIELARARIQDGHRKVACQS